ncbi:MAG: ribosomal RNA small subunit methyltransferase A [Nitrospinae bacterium]|nr:ribosomal RNA small subunit methyltransferase A [Nitrospinota bacterium]
MYWKKRFGQHFLIDESIVMEILKFANLSENETVVEIGPGNGILTSKLADIAKRVIAIEIDKRLFRFLKERLSSYNNISIINGDALYYTYGEIPERFKVVSNLPYNIATPMIIKLIEQRERIIDMIFMFQREVADRIVAKPGTKDYGALSITVQYRADAYKLLNVSRGSFKPVPKVDSSVIRITPRKDPLIEVIDEELFFSIIKAAFSHRRKTIRNNFKTMNLSDEFLEKIFNETGIKPSRRGETLSMLEFADISNTITNLKERSINHSDR